MSILSATVRDRNSRQLSKGVIYDRNPPWPIGTPSVAAALPNHYNMCALIRVWSVLVK